LKILKPILLFLTIISCSTHSNNNNNNNNDFSALIDLEGNAINLDDFNENILILNIWATWCKPCISEFESLEKVKEKFKDINVKIIAVSNEDLKLINSFLNKRKFDLDFIKLNGDLSYFNAYSLPTTIVFDKSGNEAFRLTGGVDFNTKNFIEKILNIEKL
jgi:thiol-disulfide isomerase/thioredoxin|tara:strand:+ start:1089 stop:1571 length:483 start_codon:yes stop_codon:yes gene_type:complete